MSFIIWMIAANGGLFALQETMDIRRRSQGADLLYQLLLFTLRQRNVVESMRGVVVIENNRSPVIHENINTRMIQDMLRPTVTLSQRGYDRILELELRTKMH